MAFCGSCGKQVDDGVTYCSECGTSPIPKFLTDAELNDELEKCVRDNERCAERIASGLIKGELLEREFDDYYRTHRDMDGLTFMNARNALKSARDKVDREVSDEKSQQKEYLAKKSRLETLLNLPLKERSVEHRYQQLLESKSSASSEDDFAKLAKQFREMDYKDTAELASACDNKCRELKKQGRRRKGRIRRDWIIAGMVALASAATIAYGFYLDTIVGKGDSLLPVCGGVTGMIAGSIIIGVVSNKRDYGSGVGAGCGFGCGTLILAFVIMLIMRWFA